MCNDNTQKRSPAYGRTCNDQPSGDNQVRKLSPASPAARRVNVAARTPNGAPRAHRAERERTAAPPAPAGNTRPEHANAEPNASEPAAGTSSVSKPAAPITPL